MSSFFFTSFLCGLLYLLLLRWLKKGIDHLKAPSVTPIIDGVSVIICVKDEEKIISQTLQHILAQNCDYPLEVIVVDDHSEDHTVLEVHGIISKSANVRLLSNSGNGKKDAANASRNGDDDAAGESG